MKKLIFLITGLFIVFAMSVASAAPPKQATDGEAYTVQANDWLSKIAEKYYGDILLYPAIVEATNAMAVEDDSFTTIDNPDLIEVGQKLWLPAQVEGAVSTTPSTDATSAGGDDSDEASSDEAENDQDKDNEDTNNEDTNNEDTNNEDDEAKSDDEAAQKDFAPTAYTDVYGNFERGSGIIELQGNSMLYLTEGSGIPCLAVGPTGLYPAIFSNQLKQHIQFIFVEYRNTWQAESIENVEDITMDVLVDEIDETRQALGYDEICIVGHSALGLVALEYAKKYPQHTTYTIIMGTPAVYSEAYQTDFDALWDSNADETRKQILADQNAAVADVLPKLSPRDALIVQYVANSPYYFNAPDYNSTWLWFGVDLNMDIVNQLFGVILNNYNDSANYNQITPPVFIAHGKQDFIAPYTLWEDLKETFPENFTYQLFENSGHYPSIEERALFDEKLLAWLERDVEEDDTDVNELLDFERTSGTIEVGGNTMIYIKEGSGLPCLGIGPSALYPPTFSNNLKQNIEFIFVEHKNTWQADSIENVEAITMDTLVDEIDETRQALGYDKICVLGHSALGLVALAYGEKYPEHSSHIIAIGTPATYSEAYAEAFATLWETDASAERKQILADQNAAIADVLPNLATRDALIVQYVANGPYYWYDPTHDSTWLWFSKALNMDIVNQLFGVILNNYDPTDTFATITPPVFIAQGRYDYIAPYTLWEEMEDTLPANFTYVLFEESGHFPHIEEHALFDELLLDWIEAQ